MRYRSALTAVAVCCAAVLALASPAGAEDAPKRKPGLWRQTVSTSGLAVPPQSMSMCTDQSSDELIVRRAGSSEQCSQQSVRRQGNAFVVTAVCKDGDTTVRTHGTFTGDFSSHYSGEMRTSFDPPMRGVKEMSQRIDARWIGPCQPGQKPGDVTLEGVGGMNMNELMRADPEQMKQMMEQMQRMQPRP
jgi:hypothetical protein